MSLTTLSNDIQVLILLFDLNPCYFLINKSFYENRNTLSKLVYHNKRMECDEDRFMIIPQYRIPHLFLLLQSGKRRRTIKGDFHSSKRQIIEFVANTKRERFILECVNSYHRKIVHDFCDMFNLKHETISTRYKLQRVCPRCGYIGNYYKRSYCAECEKCGERRRYHRLESKDLIPQRDVLITKVNDNVI